MHSRLGAGAISFPTADVHAATKMVLKEDGVRASSSSLTRSTILFDPERLLLVLTCQLRKTRSPISLPETLSCDSRMRDSATSPSLQGTTHQQMGSTLVSWRPSVARMLSNRRSVRRSVAVSWRALLAVLGLLNT